MNLQSILLLSAIIALAGWAWRQAGRRGGCGNCHGCSLHDHCSSRQAR